VTVTTTGSGVLSPLSVSASPFDLTYTPSVADAGTDVVITFTSDNPSGAPCAASVVTYTLTVSSVPGTPVTGTVTQPVTCDASSGSVVLSGLPASGTWTVNPGNITGTGTTTTVTGLSGGTYNFTVTSASGCTSPATAPVVINTVPGAPSEPEYLVTDPTCISATGEITVTSPTGSLTFSLDGTAFGTYPAGGYTGVAPGPHTLIAQNASGCLSPVANIVVGDQPVFENTYTKESFNISCNGQSDGRIRIVMDGSVSGYTFSWTGPNGFSSSLNEVTGLIAGDYTVVITSPSLCTATENFTISQPGHIYFEADVSTSADLNHNIDCGDGKTGTISVTAVNATGTVDYLWSDGLTGNNRTGLSAGTYGVIITDGNGCHADTTFILTAPDPITVTYEVTRPFCPDMPDGEILLTVSGGVPGTDYTYAWSDNSTTMNLSNITSGTYTVQVTDANSCSVTRTIELHSLQDNCLIMSDVISPNGDLINDFWNIQNSNLYPEMEVTIYNRWGQPVWKSGKGYPSPWDGKSDGGELPIDSYHYVIDLHNGSKVMVGDITIVR
jgi:gliding motility-associated-like protein